MSSNTTYNGQGQRPGLRANDEHGNYQVEFEVFRPMPDQTPDSCGHVRHTLPHGGMFQHCTTGLHASVGGVCTNPGTRVVFVCAINVLPPRGAFSGYVSAPHIDRYVTEPAN